MSAIEPIMSAGMELSVEPGGKLRIKGLSRLAPSDAARLVDYAKQNRGAILRELRKSKAELPEQCPLNTGDICPPGCRFETKFLIRMMEQGVLPTTGCPLLPVCGL